MDLTTFGVSDREKRLKKFTACLQFIKCFLRKIINLNLLIFKIMLLYHLHTCMYNFFCLQNKSGKERKKKQEQEENAIEKWGGGRGNERRKKGKKTK